MIVGADEALLCLFRDVYQHHNFDVIKSFSSDDLRLYLLL